MAFFFAKAIEWMMNKGIDNHHYRGYNKQPQKPNAIAFLLEKIGAEIKHWNDKPKSGEDKFKRYDRMAARYGREEHPKNVYYKAPK